MLIRMRQSLLLDGARVSAGEVVDLPSETALACLRRRTAERADLPEQNRVKWPEQNRIRLPWENRGRRRP